jgi:hypothetical protein
MNTRRQLHVGLGARYIYAELQQRRQPHIKTELGSTRFEPRLYNSKNEKLISRNLFVSGYLMPPEAT